MSEDNQFEDLAKTAEHNGSCAPHIIAAAQIRAMGREFEQQRTMTLAVESLNHEFARLDLTVKQLNQSVDKFNEDTGRLYSTLNLWTKIIATTAIISMISNLIYVSYYVGTIINKH